MEPNRYHTAVNTANPLVEERESLKYSHSLDQFAQQPAFSNAIFGSLIMLGAVLMLGSVKYGFWLALIGAAPFGYGVFGWAMLQRRLNAYQPHANLYRTEYEPVFRPSDVPTRELDVAGKNIILQRDAKTAVYAGESYQFSGKQLDILEDMYKAGVVEIRRDKSAEGAGWSETVGIGSSTFGRVITILKGKNYIEKREGMKNYVWTALGVHEFLEID